MRTAIKGWLDSATIILVAKSVFHQPKPTNTFNYKLLTLKRSAKSKFMPGTHVYPGGACSKADYSPNWLDLFESFGIKKTEVDDLKFLSHRITAIRETFEETGILICRSSKVNYGSTATPWASYIGGAEIKKWQNRVHDNDEEFINLCQHFEVYPDIWSLKEWSNWLTPPEFPKRFNTLFFLAAFHEMPAIQAEKSEVQHLLWSTPSELLQEFRNEKLMLPPPQFYETSRLLNFADIEDLADFADKRPKDLEACFPYRISTDEGIYSIYPGDDLYPDEIDPKITDVSIVEKIPDSRVKHRSLHTSVFTSKVMVCNFKPKYGHVVPIGLDEIKNKL